MGQIGKSGRHVVLAEGARRGLVVCSGVDGHLANHLVDARAGLGNLVVGGGLLLLLLLLVFCLFLGFVFGGCCDPASLYLTLGADGGRSVEVEPVADARVICGLAALRAGGGCLFNCCSF